MVIQIKLIVVVVDRAREGASAMFSFDGICLKCSAKLLSRDIYFFNLLHLLINQRALTTAA